MRSLRIALAAMALTVTECQSDSFANDASSDATACGTSGDDAGAPPLGTAQIGPTDDNIQSSTAEAYLTVATASACVSKFWFLISTNAGNNPTSIQVGVYAS